MRLGKQLLFFCVLAGCLSDSALCQDIYGTSTINVDPSSYAVTATCETDVDGVVYEFYDAYVGCRITDSNGNTVYNRSAEDDGWGTAQVTYTFTGTPGVTYTVLSEHMAYIIYGDYAEPPAGGGPYYAFDDEYFFSLYLESQAPIYYGGYDYFGPGPPTERRQQTIRIGYTSDAATVSVLCPTTVTLDQTFPSALPSVDHPDSLTGIGILTRMLTSPSVSNYAGASIQELVLANTDSCPASIQTYTDFPNIVTSFTVYTPFYFEGVQFPSILNTFYDEHVLYVNFDVLGTTSASSCTSTATQVYSCNGNDIGTFSLTNQYVHGSISGVPVTNVTTTKQ